jgi:uncharacterized protein (TIGR03790 family)
MQEEFKAKTALQRRQDAKKEKAEGSKLKAEILVVASWRLRVFALKRTFFAVTLGLMAMAAGLRGADRGQSVVLIYNTRLPESKDVADHYAARRTVPPGQILGLDLSTGETMSRTEYREQLQRPLLKFLEQNGLFVYPRLTADSEQKDVLPISAKVRYAVLCYGVPLRIGEDPTLADPGSEKIRAEWKRNGAAVDSELCTLPVKNMSRPLAGPLGNRLYGAIRASALNPANGLLLVARLDGPTADIARALVDKALDAESNGLWGRAYFDLRGLTNGELKKGDDWIRAAAETTRRFGFGVVVDDKPETFPVAFPMSQIALYAGWYDGTVSGPFTRPKVEFMPGAFAYHLHSYSAATLRSATENWCGPFLAAGVTATMGCVNEPYLEATPNVDVFFARWLDGGFTFGEAAYACQRALSWQTTVIGDPLYLPFELTPKERHQNLEQRHSKLIEWSVLQFVNKGLELGATTGEMMQFLLSPEAPQDSAVLAEKRAELEDKQGLTESAIKSLRNALKFDPTPQQRVRLTFKLADRLTAAGREAEVLALYDDFIKSNPDYPDAIGLYSKMEVLATKLHQTHKAEQYARSIADLTSGK